MQLNRLAPAKGAKRAKKRVGRGIGSGSGKTAGRGHKGQKSRAGGFHKVGFEGGQMPLQRRLPKRGFTSLTAALTAEVRLDELARLNSDQIDLDVLREAKMVKQHQTRAKVIGSGEVARKFTLKGIKVSRGARSAIEAAGGRVEDEGGKPVPGSSPGQALSKVEGSEARPEKSRGRETAGGKVKAKTKAKED